MLCNFSKNDLYLSVSIYNGTKITTKNLQNKHKWHLWFHTSGSHVFCSGSLILVCSFVISPRWADFPIEEWQLLTSAVEIDLALIFFFFSTVGHVGSAISWNTAGVGCISSKMPPSISLTNQFDRRSIHPSGLILHRECRA